MKRSRRHFLIASTLGGVGLAAYSYERGVRLPTLHWGPAATDNDFTLPELGQVVVADLIKTPARNGENASFRAYAPEPTLSITFAHSGSMVIGVGNVANDAILQLENDETPVTEETVGISRTLRIDAIAGKTLVFSWKLPPLSTYTFAAIGDTGGDLELGWCIQRAHALGARFLLHLGDFNYQSGDYQRAIDHFNNSPIPIYVTIGNHDFHENGAIYGTFLEEIGPKNHAFSIGRTRFLNFDTAANIVPYGAGQRGDLFDRMAQQSGFADTVAFTHRPLYDPLPDSHHDIGSTGERDWIIDGLKACDAKTLLSGHLHIYDRQNINQIDNIIVGQGLGHQDLIVNADHSKMAMGHVNASGNVSYTMAPLAMPMALHCHPRVDPVKASLSEAPHADVIDDIKRQCSDRLSSR